MTLSDVVAVGTVHELDDLPAAHEDGGADPDVACAERHGADPDRRLARPRAGTRRLAGARPRQAGDVDAAVRNDVRGARCADRGGAAGGPRDRRLQRAPAGRRHRRRAPRRDRAVAARCSTHRTRCGSATCRRTPTRRCATGGRTGGSASASARRCGTATSAASTSEPTCWTPGQPGPARRRATSRAPCRSTRRSSWSGPAPPTASTRSPTASARSTSSDGGWPCSNRRTCTRRWCWFRPVRWRPRSATSSTSSAR